VDRKRVPARKERDKSQEDRGNGICISLSLVVCCTIQIQIMGSEASGVVPSFHLGGAPFVTSWTSGSEPIVGRSYKLNPLAPCTL